MRKAILFIALLAMSLSVGRFAFSVDEERELKEDAVAINNTPSTPNKQSVRVTELSKQFNVPEARITDLRNNRRMGLGEITISLAMAQQLSVTSKEPLTTDQALTRVLDLRAQDMGWGKIAHQLGFKLGPVVSRAHQGREAIRTADRREDRFEHKTELGRTQRPEVEKGEFREHMERPEHLEHPMRH